jgi:CDP-diacylglycerol--glycerol-3-phosphate 3-phosphatidyltransferase
MKAVPNILTIFRVLMLPVFVWSFFCRGPITAVIVFAVAFATDGLDGLIARKFNAISNFGKWADPLADKAATITVLVCLLIAGNLPWPFLAFYAAKESFMVIGFIRVYFEKGRKVQQAELPGKVAMMITAIGLGIAIFGGEAAIYAMCISVGASTVAASYYFSAFRRTGS